MAAPPRPRQERAGNRWPLEDIAGALGGTLTQERAGVWSVRLTNPTLGTRLVLKLAPAHRAVRLIPERSRKSPPWTIGQVDFFGVGGIRVREEGTVTFCVAEPPQELLVTSLAQFQLVVGLAAHLIDPIPPALAQEETPITVTGRLARPKYSEPQGRQLWTAGLAEDVGAASPVWHNLVAWGKHASEARGYARGQTVRVTGKLKEERYEKEGETRTTVNLVVSTIEPV